MATTVSTRGRTKVRRVLVGKPIRRIKTDVTTNITLATLGGVDISAAVEGSTLVYNASTGNFEANTELEAQTINGGQY